ncbi:MAG: putative glycosyltransferase [Microgenomates group bacterium GW2011_GWA2_37_6]|nr:MAG: putative glycosyltransferase [Microgenomates group bacterium GW2011_GWA2_37_6]
MGKVIWYAGGAIDWENVIGNHKGLDEVDKGQFDEDGETKMATGCCFLVKKEVLEKVGLYDDRYFLYFEDADFSERVKKAGFKIFYAPKSIIWHKNAQSSGGSGSSLQDYFTTRNRLIFGYTYAPMRTKIALFRQSLNLILKGRPWQRRGIIDFYLGRLGKGSYRG